MKAYLLALLFVVATSSFASQPRYTNRQVIEYAKSIDVHTLDTSLPSQPLEAWLRLGPPHAEIRWDVSDTCDNKPDPGYEYPLCAKIWFRRSGEAGSFLIQVGKEREGIQGQPQLYNGIISWEDGGGWIMTGGAAKLSELPNLLDQPAYAHGVGQLYDAIVERHPIGTPSDAMMAGIRPLLSRRLAERLLTAKACEADYLRQPHTRSDNAAEPAWLKRDLFSGDGNRVAPASAWPVREGQQKDGSYLVMVNLFGQTIDLGNGLKAGAYSSSGNWHVEVRVVPEDGKFVVDDVRLFDGSSTDGASRLLSDSFAGCDGPHWTGQIAANR